MAASKTPHQGPVPSQAELARRVREATGNEGRWWSNGPREEYGWHDHPYHKVLFCSKGSIVFHMRDAEVELAPGDRLDIDPGTEHAATVGAEGVTCVEAERS
jgi:quercetin dioxygenase-like cupin family protein